MNAELVKQALAKVGNPKILVNLVSHRVRQLNSHGSRPLITETAGLHSADIALLEIAENKMTWEPDDESLLLEQVVKKKKKS